MELNLLKYFRMQVGLGHLTIEEIQKKYPDFTMEDEEK